MNILVIGLGGCGARIADEFKRHHDRAKRKRDVNIVTGAFAVSTDAEELASLTSLEADYAHRILLGARQFHGAGLNGDNELGALVMEEHADIVLEEMRQVPQFFETDAVLIVAGVAGGFGSGALPVLVQHIKRRFREKLVYTLAVLPAEKQENDRAIQNAAVSLKSLSSVADAIFLFDNGLMAGEGDTGGDYLTINQNIVEPFYNLLCAGAEKRKKHIGAKLLDAGDVIQTIGGWTVIGIGKVDLPSGIASFLQGSADKENPATGNSIRAIDNAIGTLMELCRPEDASTALYLITAPAREINVEIIKALGQYLKNIAPRAIIRSGDYPIGRGTMEVTVILSRLRDVERVRRIYTRSGSAPEEKQESLPDTQS